VLIGRQPRQPISAVDQLLNFQLHQFGFYMPGWEQRSSAVRRPQFDCLNSRPSVLRTWTAGGRLSPRNPGEFAQSSEAR
jgi:hypothetical protein